MPIHTINGCPIHYHVAGEGVPVLFIHPPLMTSAVFVLQQAGLSDDFQTVVYDIRGHGHSGASRQPLTYTLLAEDIKQLMDRLGLEQAYLCGYSSGGGIALEAMLIYPDHFLGAVLISAMPKISDLYSRLVVAAAAGVSRVGGKRLLSSIFSYVNSGNRDAFFLFYRDANNGNVRNWSEYFRSSLFYDGTSRLIEIKQPVLLVCGGKDKTYLKYAQMLQRELPDAELHVLPGQRHQLPNKAAPALNELIRRWLYNRHYDSERSAQELRPEPAAGVSPYPLPPEAAEPAQEPELQV